MSPCIIVGLAAIAIIAVAVPSVIINCIAAVITSVAVVLGLVFVYNVLAIFIIITVIAFFG